MSWSSARLGFVHLDLGLYSDPSNPAWLPKARGELDRALELEPELALPHLKGSPAIGRRAAAGRPVRHVPLRDVCLPGTHEGFLSMSPRARRMASPKESPPTWRKPVKRLPSWSSSSQPLAVSR